MIASPTEGAATETLRVHRCQTIDECSKRLRRLLRKRDRPGKQQAEERIGPAHPFCLGEHKVSPRAGQFARFVWRQSKRIDRGNPAHRVHLESIHSTFSDENALEPPLTDSRAFLAHPETSPSRLTSSRRPNPVCSSPLSDDPAIPPGPPCRGGRELHPTKVFFRISPHYFAMGTIGWLCWVAWGCALAARLPAFCPIRLDCFVRSGGR